MTRVWELQDGQWMPVEMELAEDKPTMRAYIYTSKIADELMTMLEHDLNTMAGQDWSYDTDSLHNGLVFEATIFNLPTSLDKQGFIDLVHRYTDQALVVYR